MSVKFSTIIKFIAVAFVIGGLTFIQSPASAQSPPLPPGFTGGNCPMSESGTTSDPIIFYVLEMPAGSTLTVVMNTTSGSGTGIVAISSDATLLILSEAYKSPHAASYTATKDTLVLVLLVWEVAGLPQNTYSVTLSGCGEGGESMAGPPATNLFDGRLNNSQLRDVAAPVAIYCADGNIDVYKINAETGDGTRVISFPQVEGLPESGTNTELASAEGISLYWLSDGPYQLNTPNFEGILYSITWLGCDSSTLAHLAP